MNVFFVPGRYFSSDKAWKVKTEKTALELISPFCYLALEENNELLPAAGVSCEPWEAGALSGSR